MRRMRIQSRIFLPVLVLLILLPLAAWVVFGITADRYMQDLAEEELQNLLELMQPVVDEVFREPEDAAPLNERQREQLEQAQAKEFLARMKLLLKNDGGLAQMLILSYRFEPVYPKSIESQPGTEELYAYYAAQFSASPESFGEGAIQRLTLNGRRYLVSLQQIESTYKLRAKYLIAYSPVYDTAALRGGTARLVLVITATLAALSLTAMWMVAGSISRPIRRLCAHAKRIGRGDFRRIEEKSALREIDELRAAMNEMSEQIGRAEEAQRTFFQNASHELRTPLMSIGGYAQGIQCGIFDDNAEAAGTIMAESKRLTDLVDGILTLSRLDNDQLSLDLEPVCLWEFIEDSLRRLEGLTLAREVAIDCGGVGRELWAEADGELLCRVFGNLLSNCIRYAEGRIAIRAAADGPFVRLTVADDGPGFSGEDLAHLFERFYKGKGGNFGIGLAIAKSSMEYMGGGIRAYNGETGGAVFELRLRRSSREAAES